MAEAINAPHDYESWEEFWKTGIKPGETFDKKFALPELVHQLSTEALPRGARALVPGCGRGYAVEALSKSGRYDRVVGLDVAETAVAVANSYLAGCELRGDAAVVQGDFFEEGLFEQPFDLVYEYTFFCAIPLEWRGKWAQRMKDLVRVSGRLITVMYPMDKPREEGGPPHGVSVEDYRELLEGDGGFVARDGPRKLEDEMCHESRRGRTSWCVWERV